MKNEIFDDPRIGVPSNPPTEISEENPEYALDDCSWDITDNSTFVQILGKMNNIYKRKQNDYGNSFKQTMDKFGILSSVIRINDKVNRLNNLVDHSKEISVVDESLEDTLLDLANYCVMTLAYLRDAKKSV